MYNNQQGSNQEEFAKLTNSSRHNPSSFVLNLAKVGTKLWYSNIIVVPIIIYYMSNPLKQTRDTYDSLFSGGRDNYGLAILAILTYNVAVKVFVKYASFDTKHHSQYNWLKRNLDHIKLDVPEEFDVSKYIESLDPSDTLKLKKSRVNKLVLSIKGSVEGKDYSINELYQYVVPEDASKNGTDEYYTTLIVVNNIVAPHDFWIVNKVANGKLNFLLTLQIETESSDFNKKFCILQSDTPSVDQEIKTFLNPRFMEVLLDVKKIEYAYIFFQKGSLFLYTKDILDEETLESTLQDVKNLFMTLNR